MRIIKEGKIKEYIAVCNKCGCEFAYEDKDVHHDNRDGDSVVCPCCCNWIGISTRVVLDMFI